MSQSIPESKLKRTVVGGKTAANVGGKVLKYLAKSPFLKPEQREAEKAKLEKDYAAEIFKGLVLLKGTALKIAQLLSLELDIIPKAIRTELEKSYNQVPPINRALVRKMIVNSFHEPPESLFKEFDYKAFAAASLGQVHYATSMDGKKLAIKIQYPGIDRTIKNDLQIVRGILKPTSYARFAYPVLVEIEKRLLEELDYQKESENTQFFKQNLEAENVVVPAVDTNFCTKTVLATEHLEGPSLDQWIQQNPSQAERNQVASTLYNQFLKSLFELKTLHADPNPGNFIVMKDLKVGLVDFGCVKSFSDEFIELYRKFSITVMKGSADEYLLYIEKMNILKSDIDKNTKAKILSIFQKVGRWYAKLYEGDVYDFGKDPEFFNQGKQIMQEVYEYKKYLKPNPEFVFLNRTHYGLFRIFERLKAKIRIKNEFEGDVAL